MFILCPIWRGSSPERGLAPHMTDRHFNHLLSVSVATLMGTAGMLSLSWPFQKKNRRRKGRRRRRKREKEI